MGSNEGWIDQPSPESLHKAIAEYPHESCQDHQVRLIAVDGIRQHLVECLTAGVLAVIDNRCVNASLASTLQPVDSRLVADNSHHVIAFGLVDQGLQVGAVAGD